MEWKNKIQDECCADELEEMISNYVRAGFWSNREILEECEQYMEDFYRDECENITKDELLAVIEAFRKTLQNTGSQENFLRLESVFRSLMKQGIVALHYAGYTQSDGFEDCNEAAAWLEKKGEKVIGCCFYTQQDLEHILHGDGTLLRFSFGNYRERPTAEEVGRAIADALKSAGFCVQWDGTAERKIAIEDFQWDKYYTGGE